MPHLLDPLTIRGVTLRNRIGISPMQQYCANADGKPTAWHLATIQPRAAAGAGLAFTEATSVSPLGRVNYNDVGLWDDAQIEAHRVLASAVRATGAVSGVQLGHGGRKACRPAPWSNDMPIPLWTTLAPSALAFGDFAIPHAMTADEITTLVESYAAAARRAAAAGYQMIEIHAAHGYLLHSFLSPLSNRRDDEWGGVFENRIRLVLSVVSAVRVVIPDDMPLWLRVSHSDWVEGGWTTDQTVELAVRVRALGVDVVDASSGGLSPEQKIPLGRGYQVPGAQAIRERCGPFVAAVGMITEPLQAEAIIAEGKADIVLLARAALREPHWPLRAAVELQRPNALKIPPQYARSWTGYGDFTIDVDIAQPLAALA
jgi:2,4-dienoyl-CoA reductase-like NADH-dependent reductase (Old Yellow Enzyme family)